MFKIDPITKQISLTRGDIANFRITAKNDDGSDYTFQVDDVVRFKVFKKKDCACVEIQKDTTITEESTIAYINLTSEETKIGEIINKPVDYWYEVELNPDTNPQTIVGYEVVDGQQKEKIFKLLPEGSDKQ